MDLVTLGKQCYTVLSNQWDNDIITNVSTIYYNASNQFKMKSVFIVVYVGGAPDRY